jgi:alpha-ketoglutarate-dependent taurine dioxygenase
MTEQDMGKPRIPAAVRRREVTMSGTEWVKVRALATGRGLPVVVEPALDGVDLIAWAPAHKDFIDEHLARTGGILFTGFGIDTPEALQRLIQALSGQLLEYTYRSTPRSQVSGDIYTSTEHPSHQHIPLHNEMSYSRSWPLRIAFLCLKVAERGGETPIADSRRVFERIDPAIRQRFIDKQVMYVRNYGEGVDLPWENVFQTRDPEVVEELCRARGIAFEWKDGNRLRTRQVCQAVATHPKSGEQVWFNQAHLFHPSSLDPAIRESMMASFGEDGLPRNACYGDGSRIEDAVFDEIRAAYDAETITFPWRSGDVLLLDNMLVAHGRRPFEGSRRIVVGMAEPHGTDMEARS